MIPREAIQAAAWLFYRMRCPVHVATSLEQVGKPIRDAGTRDRGNLGQTVSTRDDPRYAGYWLVNRIIIRRRNRCARDRKHTIGYCLNCGVHQ